MKRYEGQFSMEEEPTQAHSRRQVIIQAPTEPTRLERQLDNALADQLLHETTEEDKPDENMEEEPEATTTVEVEAVVDKTAANEKLKEEIELLKELREEKEKMEKPKREKKFRKILQKRTDKVTYRKQKLNDIHTLILIVIIFLTI